LPSFLLHVLPPYSGKVPVLGPVQAGVGAAAAGGVITAPGPVLG